MAGQQVKPDPYIGEIRLMAFDQGIKGWSKCNGSLLPIAGNEALFNLIGTKYGGNGTSNFALPDLQSRVPISVAQGFATGKYGGEEMVTLQAGHLPVHRHTVHSNNEGGLDVANGNFWGYSSVFPYAPEPATLTMNAAALSSFGGGGAHENRIPFQAVDYYIALQGQYPSKDSNTITPPYLSELRIFSFDFAPEGWIPCNGQILPISTNTALFSLVDNVYGGNGQTNFALPDLQARVPMHTGSNMPRGAGAGEAGHTLTTDEIPSHTHTAQASSNAPDSATPQNNFWAERPGYTPYGDENDNPPMSATALSVTGEGLPHNNMAPYVVLNICIATAGLYPIPGDLLPGIDSEADNYIGEIRMFAGNVVPAAWAPCNGQILPISTNATLFSLLGNLYGGNGQTNFALPNLQARAATCCGKPSGLTPYKIGATGGQVTVTLTANETPAHTHTPNAAAAGTQGGTAGMLWAAPGAERPAPNFYATAPGTPLAMNADCIDRQGGGQPHNNLMPYTVFVFCIALNGTFPSRP